MPKISNNEITVYHKDIKRNFKIEIMYNQDHLFYAKFPEEFNEVIKHLEKSDELQIKKNVKTKDPIVCASTEGQCLSLIKKALEVLIDKTIEKRDVIIIFYEPDHVTNYSGMLYNEETPAMGFQFGLTYAVESTAGDKKVYSVYNKWKAFGEERVERKELNLWGKSSTIIPDTKENREKLESLYKAFVSLNLKMADITKTPEKMLSFISSNTKLLN